MKHVWMVMLGALVLAGCGSNSASSIAKMGTAFRGTSGSTLQAEIQRMANEAEILAEEERQKFEVQAQNPELFATVSLPCTTIDSGMEAAGSGTVACTTATATVGGIAGCQASCTYSGSSTYTCGSDRFVMSGGTMVFGFSMDLTTSGSTSTITMNMAFNMSATVSGSGFSSSGSTVACQFSTAITATRSGSTTTVTGGTISDCGSFSCTVDGRAISCADMQSALSSSSSCS